MKNGRWTKQKPPYQIGKDDFGFKDLKKDFDGWVNAKNYLPVSYDVVQMKLPKKTIPGWWNGYRWEGLRLRDEDEVLLWKFAEERGRGEVD